MSNWPGNFQGGEWVTIHSTLFHGETGRVVPRVQIKEVHRNDLVPVKLPNRGMQVVWFHPDQLLPMGYVRERRKPSE